MVAKMRHKNQQTKVDDMNNRVKMQRDFWQNKKRTKSNYESLIAI